MPIAANYEKEQPDLQKMKAELEEKTRLYSFLNAHDWNTDKKNHPWVAEWDKACETPEGCAKALDNPPVLMIPNTITWTLPPQSSK